MIGFQGKTLSSEHLTFTLLREAHKADLAKILTEAETTVPAGFQPVTTEEEFEAFWSQLTAYNTAVAILLQGQCIGYYHVNKYVNSDPRYAGQSCVGIGFLIGKNYLRRGYGTETLITMNDYLLTRFDNIFGDYFLENTASRNTLLKCGFTEDDRYEMPFEELGAVKQVVSTVLRRESQ